MYLDHSALGLPWNGRLRGARRDHRRDLHVARRRATTSASTRPSGPATSCRWSADVDRDRCPSRRADRPRRSPSGVPPRRSPRRTPTSDGATRCRPDVTRRSRSGASRRAAGPVRASATTRRTTSRPSAPHASSPVRAARGDRRRRGAARWRRSARRAQRRPRRSAARRIGSARPGRRADGRNTVAARGSAPIGRRHRSRPTVADGAGRRRRWAATAPDPVHRSTVGARGPVTPSTDASARSSVWDEARYHALDRRRTRPGRRQVVVPRIHGQSARPCSPPADPRRQHPFVGRAADQQRRLVLGRDAAGGARSRATTRSTISRRSSIRPCCSRRPVRWIPLPSSGSVASEASLGSPDDDPVSFHRRAPDRRPVLVQAVDLLRGARPRVLRRQRRRQRRPAGAHREAGLPRVARDRLPLVAAVLRLAAQGRRLRHLGLPVGASRLRFDRGRRDAHRRGPPTGDPRRSPTW